jgi:PAS domain S-box-containing protein
MAKNTRSENLRSRAERMLAENGRPASNPPRADLEKLVNELNVYRIELELQNEELRSSQEKLLESRSSYFELYNFAPVAFLTISPGSPHRVLGANSAACRLLGVNRTKLVGMSLSSFAAAKDISALSDFLEKLEGEEDLATEIRMKRKSPPLSFSAKIQARHAPKKSGKARILVALSDVTDLVRAREVLQRDRNGLEGWYGGALKSWKRPTGISLRKTWISGISHSLPLTICGSP